MMALRHHSAIAKVKMENNKELIMFLRKMLISAALVLVVVLAMSTVLGLNNSIATAMRAKDEIIYLPLIGGAVEYTTDFRLEDCKFNTTAKNPHFILQPGLSVGPGGGRRR
jgi:hypothetical protein